MSNYFVDIILPFSLRDLFTYQVPPELVVQCEIGKRVVVQFGKKKIYSAIIKTIHQNEPQGFETKNIISVIDHIPLITSTQLDFWEWMADYYMCSQGDVYKAALPSGLRLASNTIIAFKTDFFEDEQNLSNLKFSLKEEIILDALREKKSLSLDDVNKLLAIKNSIPHIKSLYDKGAILIEESLEKDFRNKQETYLKLNDDIANDDALNTVFDSLKRAKKQQEALNSFLDISNYGLTNKTEFVKRKDFLRKTDVKSASINELLRKGILISEQRTVSRLLVDNTKTKALNTLNSAQTDALSKIQEFFKKKDTVLLHGVTSSGKTEVYIHLITKYIQEGKQILYLLPEIALSTQIVERLKAFFGNKVGIYHSRYSDAERVEVWKNIVDAEHEHSKFSVILGVRSAIFLPFTNLGLIIVDEEHENTYKQFDPAPRYQARDAALMLARLHHAKTLLGSATPSIESYYNAKSGKFALVEINKRHLDIKMPEIIVSDIKEARRKKQMHSHFSPLLISNITSALEKQEQVILFQNRRGFSSYLECHDCGWIPKCENCDVSLTYHKYSNQLVCHYCGYAHTVPPKCPICQKTDIRMRGFGTERIEDDLQILFPDAKISRLDMDTTRGKKMYTKIISDFENGSTNILVGTQMVSKGLDFDNVSLVGILDANQMLNYPSFRAYERSYQLMAQVGGRAGRKNKQGKVIIQTVSVDNKIIEFVKHNDYKSLFNSQIHERMTFKYPPFNRLISITLKHKDKQLIDSASQKYVEWLRYRLKHRVLGPEDPIVGRVYNYYLKIIIVKIDKASQAKAYKDYIMQVSEHLLKQNNCKAIKIIYDVDAYN